MPWASTTEYNDAIENLRTSVSDEELRAGEPARTPQGLPMLWSGNFAAVYKVHCSASEKTWAVKCFTRESPGLRDRYRQISDHLRRARLRFMVDFEFVEPGILAGGQWHPFLKMRWVEGLALNEFVERNLDRPATLRELLGLWVKLAVRLRQAQIGHADLQHGNVILVPLPEGRLALRLIDYDGMYVPSLAGRRSGELGHPAYQHPQRLRQGIYSLEVDRFSHLAIYSAVRCLTVGKRELWTRFDNADNLLFREVDFKTPEESEVFHQLWALRDEDARALVGHLFLATQTPLDRVPLLSEVASNKAVRRLSRDEKQRVEQSLGRGASGVRIVRPFVPGERTFAFGAGPSALQGGSPPARSPGRAAPKRAWWVSGQPAAGRAQPSPLPSRPFSVKRPRSASPQPIPVARKGIALDLGGGVRMELPLIPAGEFMMGSPDSDRYAQTDEEPQHRVRITEPFYLGKYEVTQDQWRGVMGSNPSFFKGPRNPVEQVSWDDCQVFLRRLNQRFRSLGGTFRLPTEAEWEYACRAGSSTLWCFGDDEGSLRDYAWYSDRTTHPVGQKRANAWGLYDVHGNVWEWCADWFEGEYYGASPSNDPQGPNSGSVRVLRGGSWYCDARDARAAYRYRLRPDYRNRGNGFRVARTP